ncbi:uncharacterized protein LOC120782103, partial [Bactrocera tryoni]|uniref:uncharacterized protein LOC120782103 n=1 Tax=Bactrocera tryoni TaxID=59916 RepID=UPI001A965C90
MSKWKNKDLEEIAVPVAFAHMAQIDNSLLRWVYTTNIISRNLLQQQLQAHAFKKRSMEDDATGPERKKSKFQIKCHQCGKIGHKIAECQQRGKNAKGYTPKGSSNGVKDRSSRCFKCSEMGYFATSCPKIRTSGNEQNYEKSVDICTVAPPKGIINLS